MNLFNIVSYCEHNKIKIRIEEIFPVDQQDSIPVEVSLTSFESINFKRINNTDKYPVFIDHDIVTTKLEPIRFEAKESKTSSESKVFYRQGTIYELPENAQQFFNFLRIMNSFAEHNYSGGLKNKSFDIYIKDNKLISSVYSFIGFIDFFNPYFISNLLKLREVPENYQNSIKLLNNIQKYVSSELIKPDQSDKPNSMMQKALLIAAIAEHNFFDLIDQTVTKEKKQVLASHLWTAFTKTGKTEELSELLAIINLKALRRLYKHCIGQQAADGKKYNENYTELNFLRHAEFSLRADGRMSIINLYSNIAYKKYYAEGMMYHKQLAGEMRHLGEIIGLKFVLECDFDHEIIFTEQSTQRLMATPGFYYHQIHLNQSIVQGIMTQSQSTFFQPRVNLDKKGEIEVENFATNGLNG